MARPEIALWASGTAGEAISKALDLAPDLAVRRDGGLPEEGGALVWYEPEPAASMLPILSRQIAARYQKGMGLVLLGGAVFSTLTVDLFSIVPAAPAQILNGERVWMVNPRHPLSAGLPSYVDIPGRRVRHFPADMSKCSQLLCLSMLDGQKMVHTGFCYERTGRALCLTLGGGEGECYAFGPMGTLLLNAVCWACRQANRKSIHSKEDFQ